MFKSLMQPILGNLTDGIIPIAGLVPTQRFDFRVSLPSLVNFTRASSGSFNTSAGLVATASSNVARITHDFVSLTALGILIETAGTNLVSESEDLSGYDVFNGTRTNSFGTAPDGVALTSTRFETSSGSGVLEDAITIGGGTASKTFTVSFFVKGSGAFRIKNTHGGVADNFSSDIVATTSYRRVEFTVTNNASTGTGAQIIGIRRGTAGGSVDVEVWGFQLEERAVASSYIATSGSSATRAPDFANVTDISWYVEDEGSFVVDFVVPEQDGHTHVVFDMTRFSGFTDRSVIEINSSGNMSVTVRGGGSTSISTSVAVTAGDNMKVGISYKLNDFAISINGAIVTDTSGAVPSSLQEMGIGFFPSNNNLQADTTIAIIDYYTPRLENDTLQELTA